MSKFITVNDITEAVIKCANGRVMVLYTGHNTNPECAEHLAAQLPMRGEWIYWDGKSADAEPPVYVPVMCGGLEEQDAMEYLQDICQLCARMGASLVEGDVECVDVPGTDGAITVDTAVSTDRVVLVCISEEYEFFLDNSDESV